MQILPSNLFDVTEHTKLASQKLEYEKRFLKWWKEEGVDALIMPVMPWVNYPPKVWVKSKQWLGYTAIWNFLNFTSLAIPVTKVDPAIDVSHADPVEPRNESDEFNLRQCKKHAFLTLTCADR